MGPDHQDDDEPAWFEPLASSAIAVGVALIIISIIGIIATNLKEIIDHVPFT